MRKYKCQRCNIAFDETQTELSRCPECGIGDMVVDMCPRDHCECHHDVVDGIAYCPDCGEAMCPICESHDVSQHSRITGYIQEVAGFNAGKAQELKDRKRYDVV